jgi:putative heme-binding domain-containing protein
MAGAGENPEFAIRLLRKASTPVAEKRAPWQVPVLNGLALGFRNRPAPIAEEEQKLLMQAFFGHPVLAVRQASLQVLQAKKLPPGPRLQAALPQARRMAGNRKAPEENRVLAIGFLALSNPAAHAPFLKELIATDEHLPVRLAALKAFSTIPDPMVSHYLLEQWPALPPGLQDAALNTFMVSPERITLLLDAVESGRIQQASIGWPRSVRLMTQQQVPLRDRARALLAKDGQRQKVIEQYQPALRLQGDLVKGKLVYQKSCAVCHQVKGGMGVPFGPDLGTIQSWPATGTMANILDPNQSIADSYDLWTVMLKNGESLQGVISAETPSSITLRNANGLVSTIARQDIASQKAMNMSAMPTGLEKQINPQEMADLLAFLRQSK